MNSSNIFRLCLLGNFWYSCFFLLEFHLKKITQFLIKNKIFKIYSENLKQNLRVTKIFLKIVNFNFFFFDVYLTEIEQNHLMGSFFVITDRTRVNKLSWRWFFDVSFVFWLFFFFGCCWFQGVIIAFVNIVGVRTAAWFVGKRGWYGL